MDSSFFLSLNYPRRFGVEIETNAFDGISDAKKNLPEGIYYVSNIISKTLSQYVEVRRWGHTHWDKTAGYWVVKPDSSCGIEACSPVSRGWYGLKQILQVVEAFGKDDKIVADSRCSFHVHVDVSDLTVQEVGNVIRYWVKAEKVFLDSVPYIRKNSRYCQAIGLWDWLLPNTQIESGSLIKLLGESKYTTLNTFHLTDGKRPTLEFRIAEHTACKNPYWVKNWVRLVLHFVEMAKGRSQPMPYVPGDPWTGFVWFDPFEVFELLGFDGSYVLTEGMKQVRNWFLARLVENVRNCAEVGIYSKQARLPAMREISEIALNFIKEGDMKMVNYELYPVDFEQAVFGNKYRV
jgi:hypothetical protein